MSVPVLSIVERIAEPPLAAEPQQVSRDAARAISSAAASSAFTTQCEADVAFRNRSDLSAIIRLDVGVPVEVVGREVGQHANRRRDRRRVVQLVRGHLERDPRRRVRLERDLAQRRADVSRDRDFVAKAAQQVTDDRRDGRLSVRSRDGDITDVRARPTTRVPSR